MKKKKAAVKKESMKGWKGFESFPKISSEINLNIGMLFVFDTIIDSLVVFAAFSLIFMLVTINAFYAAIPSALYFLLGLYLRLSRNKLIIVEKQYTELDEKLRTAADNINLKNEVAEALDKEIASDVGKVELCSFFRSNKNAAKIIALVGLCFLIVFLSSLNTQFIDIKLFIEEVIKPNGASGNAQIGVDIDVRPLGDEIVLSPVTSGDIYGEESMIPGNITQQIEVNPIGYEMNIQREGEEYYEEFEENFPKEIFAQSAEAHEENIPVEKQELVKRYFKEVAK